MKHNAHVVYMTDAFGFYWFTLLHKIKCIKKLFFHEDKLAQRGDIVGTVHIHIFRHDFIDKWTRYGHITPIDSCRDYP